MKNSAASTLIIATRNQGKLREFHNLLRPLQFELRSLNDVGIEAEIEESGNTFAENARIKAIGYSRLTSLPVLADDSGLEVIALGGRPGIQSARYAGANASDSDRIRKLLAELDQAGAGSCREARFVCSLAVAHAGALRMESEGECRGLIITEPRGSDGFGYDPIFLFPSLNKTFAELNESEKNQYSHRARAVAALLKLWNGKEPFSFHS
jgi:XTP/dITP diphosphohydrolase